jgi:hypothetical protein
VAPFVAIVSGVLAFHRLLLWLFLLSSLQLSGCSSLGVEPWQRDVLSRPEMQFGNTDLMQQFSRHFYFSKEASSGGSSFAGGGCGCN